MAGDIRKKLTLETHKARADVKNVTGAMRQFGKETDRAGAAGSKAMRSLKNDIITLGASAASLAGVISMVKGLVSSYERAHRLHQELQNMRMGVDRGSAGFASQFPGISEATASQAMFRVGIAAGSAPEDMGSLRSLMTAANSNSLVGSLVEGKGFSRADEGKLGLMAGFTNFTGAQGSEADLAKLVSLSLAGKPATKENIAGVLGQLQASFRGSASSDRAEFHKGTLAGTVQLLAQNVDPATAFAVSGGLVKQGTTAQRTGETLRMISEKIFTAPTQGMQDYLAQNIAGGRYGFHDLKAADPTRLFNESIGLLTSQTGAAQDALAKQVGLTPTEIGRLTQIRAAGSDIANVKSLIQRTGTSSALLDELSGWQSGSRAARQRTQMRMAQSEYDRSLKPGLSMIAAAKDVATTEERRMERDSPTLSVFREWIPDNIQSEMDFERVLKRTMKQNGFMGNHIDEIDYTENGIDVELNGPTNNTFRQGIADTIRGLTGNSEGTITINGGNVIQGGTHYNRTPLETSTTTATREAQ